MLPGAVLTDLDGTLLDRGGVLGEEARAAVARLRGRGIPVVPLTSKTEIELRGFLAEHDLGGLGSFENGAGVVAPGGTLLSEKAVPIAELSAWLIEVARLSGLALVPAAALSAAEIRRVTGLPDEKVAGMLARGFDLPFLAPEAADGVLDRAAAAKPGFRLARGGQFWHLSGDHGKEDAVDLLLRGGLVSRPLVGLGDASNDAGFLALCDAAVIVPRGPGGADPALAAALPAARVAPFPEGRGWAAAVAALLAEEAP